MDYDNKSFATNDIYSTGNKEDEDIDMVLPDIQEDKQTGEPGVSVKTMLDDGFKLVGKIGKVSWDFILTNSTTDNEIKKIKISKLI